MPKRRAEHATTAEFLRPRDASQRYGISRATLAQRTKTGRVRAVRLGSGPNAAFRYRVSDLRCIFGEEREHEKERTTILYARVSSSKQKEAGDLERQIEALRAHITDDGTRVEDVASGLNFRRKGLLRLLERVEAGDVARVVVTYKDRLARFATDLLERTFRAHGTTLDVVSRHRDEERSDGEQRELGDDLLAVCNHFVAKNNGRRAAALRRGRKARRAQAAQDPGGAQEGRAGDGLAHAHAVSATASS